MMDEIKFGRLESTVDNLERLTTDHDFKIEAYRERLDDIDNDMEAVKERLTLLHDLPQKLNDIIKERRNGEKWFNRLVIAGLLGLVFMLIKDKIL